MEGAVPLPGLSLDYVDPNKEYVLMNKEGKTIKSGGDNGYVSQAIGEGIPLQVNQAGEWSTPYTYKPEKVDVGYDEKNNTLKVSASNAFMNSSFGATFQKDLQTKLDTVKTLDDLNTALTQINTDWGENGGQIELYNGATVEARKISPDFGIDQLKIYNETATAPFDDTTGKINPDAEVYEIRPFDMKLDVDENGMAKKVPYKQLLGRIASLRDTEQEKYLKSLSELSRNRQVDPNYRAAAMAISRAWERDKGVADQFKTEITNAGGKGFLGLGLSGTNELSNRLAEESNAAAQAAGDLLDANNIASEEGEYYDVINKVPDSPEKRKVVWKYENARRRYEEEYWYQKQWNEEVREQNQRVYDIAETGVDLVSAAFPQFGAAMLAEQAIVYAIGAGLEHQWGVENSITTDMQDQFTRRYAGMTANEMEKVFASGDAGKIIATVANLGMNIGFDAVDIATVFKNASISQKVAGKSVKQYVTEGLFAQNLLDTMAPPTNQFVSALSKAVGKRIVGGAVVGGVLGGTTTALNIATGLVESDNAAGDIAMGALGGAARGALVSGVGNALQLGTRYNGAEPMAVTSGGRAIQAPILHQDGTTTGRNLTQAEFDAMDVQSRSRVREWSSPLDMDIIRSQIEIRGGFRVLNPDSDIPTPEGYSARPITLADVGSGRSVDLFTKNSESTTIPTTKVESTPFAVDPVLNDDGTAIVMKSTESVDWHRVPEASSTESPVVKHYKEISEPHQAIRKMRIKAPVSPGAVEGFSKQTYIEYPKTASGDVLKAVMIKPASRVNYAMATRLLENMGFDKAGVAELNKIQTDAFARGETDMTIYATALSEVMPARAIDTVDLSSGRYEVNAESQELARISEALTGYATLLKNEGFDPEVDSLASIETKLNNLGNRYEAIIELMRPVMPSLDSQKPIAEVAPSARSGVVDEVRSRIEQAKSLDDGAQVRALYDTMLDDLELQARGAGFESKREGTPTNSRGISGALYEMDNIEKGRTVRAAFSTEQQSVFDTVYAMQRVAYEYQLESRSMGLISSKLKLSDIGDTGKYHIPHASNNSLASRIGANVANRMNEAGAGYLPNESFLLKNADIITGDKLADDMRSALGVYLQDMTFVNVDLENAAYKLMYDTQNELGPTLTLEQAKNQVRNSVDFDRSRRLANESVKLLHSQYELNQVLNSEINSGKTMRQLKKELNKNIQDYHNRVKGNDAAAQATRRQKTYDESQGVTENRRSYLWTGNRPPLQSVVDLANRTKIGVPNGIGADRTVTLNQGVGLVQYSNKEALSIDGMKLLIKDIGVYDDAGGINTDGIDKTFNIMFKNSEVENNASARYYQSRKVGLWEVPDTGYENALLYKRDWELIRKYFTERVTDSISTARNEYKMRQDITAAFRNTYYMATARAIDNVGWKYRLDNNQSKFIFNQVYGQIHKESPKVSARSNLTNAFVSGRVSSALGGIRQATFMNVPEVGYILMMRGQSFKDVIPHLWRNREELKSRYSAISDISDNDMAAIGKLSGVTNATQLMAKIATSPFGFTQRLSSYIFLASADLTAQKNGLTGPQRSMYVQHAFNKMAITNSGLSALTTAQGAMGKFMIFQNWLLKDYKRLINTIGSNINDTDIPPVQRFRGATRALTAWLGVKGATWVGMSLLFNTTFGSVFGANPFGIFDTYDELSEQERVWFDGIVDFFDKFMFLAQPATDLYYSLRNSVWATPKTDTDAEGNPVGEVASSPFDFGQWAGNALLDVTPAGGHIKAVADSMRLMNEGASYGSTGVRQYESPEDFMNILRAFLTGKGSTDNAMEYKQQASFNNLLNALSNGEDLWDAVDDELTKLQNDPWIMGVLDFIPGAQSELDAQRAEAATQQWKNPNGRVFMPYKVTTDPDEPGGNFNGGYGDGQKFNNEYYKLKKRHDDPDFLAAARRIYSQYAFWSTQEGSEAKAEADKFMRQFNSLTKDLVDDIRILADNWIAAGHEYGEKEMTMLRSLLDFGVEAVTGFDLSEARTREYAQSALPERTDVARLYDADYVTQAQKAAQNRSYGAPEAMVADFKQVLEGGNGVPKLREAYDKYWAEIRSASAKQDYSKANALAWEYIEKQFVPRIQGVVGEYGPDIAINNKEIIEMLADLMIVPNEAMSVKNKQGRYVSTKGSPMLNVAEGVVRNFIKNLYGAYGDDAPNRASDYAVTTGVRDIKIALESGQEGRAKSIADRLYTQIDAGEIHASPTDFGIIQDAR